jgi:hypothetical protein
MRMEMTDVSIVGKHMQKTSPDLSGPKLEWEKARPERKELSEFAFIDRFDNR